MLFSLQYLIPLLQFPKCSSLKSQLRSLVLILWISRIFEKFIFLHIELIKWKEMEAQSDYQANNRVLWAKTS